jgi:two-component system, chemotaxis family, CheB/CheR fusion protein
MSPVRKSANKSIPFATSGDKDFSIVGIGASAGGLEAFQSFLRNIPNNTGMAFVFIQHQAPTHPSALSELLKKSCSMPVHLAKEGVAVRPNNVYVIPPNAQMTIEDGFLRLLPRPVERVPFLPIDHFFQSLAAYCKKQAIGVILSGTASDGTLGLRDIKAAGGITFAQDDKSAKFSGMPHHAVATDVVDFVLPPEQIATEIVQISSHPLVVNRKAPTDIWSSNSAALTQIFAMLRKQTGVDFTHYKPSTVMRRITRRMLLHRIETLEQYVAFLRENPSFIQALYEDMLIHVTSFFRDPETFDTLKHEIFPRIIKGGGNRPVRIWVPGCSTGEEVYSIAMAFEEYLGNRMKTVSVQIFGTDISETAIEKARGGYYPFSIASEVSPERLNRFFIKADDCFQMSKLIRSICVFARHNVVKDPPFSKIDLVSCRNLLIYLGPVLQKKVVPIFHYALNPSGYLLLGNNETITSFGDFFFPVDKKYRIYAKKSVSSKARFDLPKPFSIEKATNVEPFRWNQETSSDRDVLREAERLILSRYAPASVITDENFEIVQFRGHTSDYLMPPQGHATFNIIRMAKEGIVAELRAALLTARKEKVAVRKESVRVQVNGQSKKFNLEVTPYTLPRSNQYHYIVLFDDGPSKPVKSPKASALPKKGKTRAHEIEIEQMQSELTSTKEFLQSIIEEQEITNAELRAANEEILSSIEELQSANEEMETAKEELESSNEELTTVNEELQIRNVELTHLNNDLNNLLASVYIPIVILGVDLRIRRFTPGAEKVLNLIPGDIGRPITDVNLNIAVSDLEQHLKEVIETMNIKDLEVRDKTNSEYSLQIRPYKTSENKIEGAILVLINIDRLKRRVEIRRTEDYISAVLETLHEPFAILDDKLCIKMANIPFRDLFKLSKEQLKARSLFEIGKGTFNIPKLRSAIDTVLRHHSNTKTVRIENKLPGAKRATMDYHVRRMDSHQGSPMILIGISGWAKPKRNR